MPVDLNESSTVSPGIGLAVAMVAAGKATKGRAGLVEGQLVMKATAEGGERSVGCRTAARGGNDRVAHRCCRRPREKEQCRTLQTKQPPC